MDLSHRISAGVTTYPGLPAPVITPRLTREQSRAHSAPGTEFAMDVISMIGSTGTYLVEAREPGGRGIGADALADRALRGSAVLLHTGWDRRFGRADYGTGAPYLTEEGARSLVDAEVGLVGIDSVNIDDAESGGARPAHSLLLAAGIHVVEHLTRLEALPADGARFTAAPPAIERFGTFPVRAYATVPGAV